MTDSRKTHHIVIIGRPNVGKSTLFNRLVGSRQALVHDEPGVTRDRIIEKACWWVRAQAYPVEVTDTGGLGGERFREEIQSQVETALETADAVIAVFDAQTGVTAADEELVQRLQKSGMLRKLPVLCAINKVDAETHESMVSDFYSLGFENVLTISAEHGRGIDDLQEAMVELLKAEPLDEEGAAQERLRKPVEELPRIAIVGRPNVGKSTLTNAILGQERMITSPIAGTTVDAVDSRVELDGHEFLIVDTAGIRKKSKTEQGVEVLSVVQARKALERADCAILLLDGEKGTTDQDEKIGGLIEEAGCSVILAVNKWDTQRKNEKFTQQHAAERIRKTMAYLKYAPILFLSAKEGTGIEGMGELISEILEQRGRKIATREFSEWVREEANVHNPGNARFYLCHQAGRHPPTFVCHVNSTKKVDFSLKRHLINALRERWGYMGTPVRMVFVEGKNTRTKPGGR